MDLERLLKEYPVKVTVCVGNLSLFFEPVSEMWLVIKGAGVKRKPVFQGASFENAFDMWSKELQSQ